MMFSHSNALTFKLSFLTLVFTFLIKTVEIAPLVKYLINIANNISGCNLLSSLVLASNAF